MILIIEDNVDVNHMLSETLRDAGFQTKSVYTGIDGMKELRVHEYEMVLLDLMLPYKSGDQILKELRNDSDTPVIVISAKGLVTTKIELLRLGADDYITKPFDLEEMVARVESLIRRSSKAKKKEVMYIHKNLRIFPLEKRVEIQGSNIELTAKEYLILEAMMENKSNVFTKANLYEMIWREEYLGDDNTVKTHISNLRAKIKKVDPQEEYIETVWGLGYRLTKN